MNQVLLIIILVSIIALFLLNNTQENFHDLTYFINSKIGGKKAFLYNINKFVKLPNSLGNALKFDGITSFMIIPKLNFNTFTFSCILQYKKLSRKQIVASSNSGMWNLSITDNQVKLLLFTDTDAKQFVNTTKLESGKWYHIVFSYDNQTLKMYVNGILNKFTYSNPIKMQEVIIGTDIDKNAFFLGYIGHINIYNRVLTRDYICHLAEMCYKKPDPPPIKPPPPPPPKCEYITMGKTKPECILNCIKTTPCSPMKCKQFCDDCNDEEMCKWLKPKYVYPKCDFIPYGSTKLSCINKCITNEKCDYVSCQETCNSCTDRNTCSWVEPPPKPKEKMPMEPPPLYDPKGRPLAPKIFITPYNGKVKVEWAQPYQGNAPIEAYISFIFKTFNKGEGVRINMVPFPKCEECVHVIDELDEEETYSVGIRAYNKFGVGKMSNIKTFTPVFKLNKDSKDIKPPTKMPTKIEYNMC